MASQSTTFFESRNLNSPEANIVVQQYDYLLETITEIFTADNRLSRKPARLQVNAATTLDNALLKLRLWKLDILANGRDSKDIDDWKLIKEIDDPDLLQRLIDLLNIFGAVVVLVR
jgi:hypothetical protein